jgi:hypothetical protein
MDIMLRSSPTNIHFDPSRLYLTVVSGENDISHLTITYNGIQLNKYRVVAGPVCIQDRKGKVLHAFTFGGELRIEVEEQEKICTIISTAPIFQFIQPIAIRFIEEVEIILAEQRAKWENDPHEFETRLAAAEPLVLYAACLKFLINKFELSNNKSAQHLVHFIHTEIQALHEEHALHYCVPPLSELL